MTALEDILHSIDKPHAHADKIIQSHLKKNKKWGARDRAFVAETAYDIIRHLRLLRCLADVPQDWKEIIALHFLIHKQWQMTLEGYVIKSPSQLQQRLDEALRIRAVRESYPDWLDRLAAQELGEQWDIEAKSLNLRAKVVLRVNVLKTTTEDLERLLVQSNLPCERIPACRDALILLRKYNVFGSPLFKQGLFEIQDAASQCVAPFLDVLPGMRVIDACAGAGGKSLHLACLMQNRGAIISLDTDAKKLAELARRAKRNAVHCIEPRLIDNTKIVKRLRHSADRLLLDVPCSGIGVLKRNPDTKWKLTEAQLHQLRTKQQQILTQYAEMLRPNGKLVYATCSILPSENQGQIQRFLDKQDGRFTLEEEKTLLPSTFGFDGFYMARLVKVC